MTIARAVAGSAIIVAPGKVVPGKPTGNLDSATRAAILDLLED